MKKERKENTSSHLDGSINVLVPLMASLLFLHIRLCFFFVRVRYTSSVHGFITYYLLCCIRFIRERVRPTNFIRAATQFNVMLTFTSEHGTLAFLLL